MEDNFVDPQDSQGGPQNPFGSIFKAPAAPTGPQNPFAGIFQPPAVSPSAAPTPADTADLSTHLKQLQFSQQQLIDSRDQLMAIQPKNAGHKARLDKIISSINTQIAGGETGANTGVQNFVRGASAGLYEGFQFPVELAGDVGSLLGNKSLQNYIEENKALLEQAAGARGKAGKVGEFVGQLAGSIPAAGTFAEATGQTALRLLPGTRIARALVAASEGTVGQRIASNVITGLPMNAVMSAGAPDIDVPEGASPEEQQRIASTNVANKIRNFAIGIGADALFGAIPSFKKTPTEVPEVAADIPLTPERQAQLDQVSATNAVKVAVKRREKLDKALAQSQWQILNPDTDWKELQPAAKRDVYDKFTEQRRNSNANTSTAGNPPPMQEQLVALDDQLKAITGQRDDARRLSETDPKLGIGNDRALANAAPAIDKDPNQVYIFADANGLKSINDAGGMEMGNQFLADARDSMIGALNKYQVPIRVFRYGGDELVAAVPKEHAETILSTMEQNSIKQYGSQTGSLSGTINETLADALSTDGKAKLTSRKIEAKAKQNIPGRDAQEQSLIDAVRQRINTEPPPVSPPAYSGEPMPEIFPPEVMQTIHEVHSAGGLQTDESMTAFTQELSKIYDTPMKPMERASHLQALIEDFTPLEAEVKGSTVKVKPDAEATAPEELRAAAVRSPDGQVFTASNHALASEKAKKAGFSDAQLDDGWTTTNADRFVNRTEAEAIDARTSGTEPTGTPLHTNRVVSPETKLRTIDTKPLEKMTERELSRADDHILTAINAVPEGSKEYKIIQQDLDAIGNEHARRNAAKAPQVTETPPLPTYGAPTELSSVGAPRNDITQSRIPSDVARLRRMSPRKMTDAELETFISDTEQARRESSGLGATTDHDEAIAAQKALDKALEERAIRAKAGNGIVPQVSKSAIQGSAGFAFGFAVPPNPDDDTSDRTTNGLMWAGLAVLGVGLAARLHAKAQLPDIHTEISDRWPGSHAADKKIVNYEDVETKGPSWRERANQWYQGIVRRSYAMDNAVNVMTGNNTAASSIPAAKNPAKLAAMFGRWVSMAEGALMDKPTYVDLAGNVQPLGAPSFREIVEMVKGDIKGLGKLMTARTSIEGQGLRTVPLDPVTSNLIFNNAPENYHQAADAMRQFDLSMATVLEKSGVLKPGSVANFSTEDFYAGLKKVFDPDAGPSKIVRDPKTRKLVVSQNPIKGRTTGTGSEVYNPAETTASMVPQVYRAAELNNIKNRLVDLWEAADKPDFILKQVERRKQPISVDQQLRVDALKQEIKGLDQGSAESLVAAFDPKSLDPRSNVMTVYREGVLRAYKVDENVAQSMASLTPDELEGMWKVLGLPAQVARQGVVLNPYFVAKQSFIDGWQATLNSTYGFRPGVDQFIGWYNIIKRSPEYQKFLGAGGGNSTLQSHDFADVRTAMTAVKHGGGPIDTAVAQARQMHLIDAWRTLITPFAEAARVGEYLRARDHGAPVLDAVYAAKHVTANFQQRGGFTMMQGLNRASMFLNPAIQGLDQATFRAGLNPFRAPEEGRQAAAAKYLSKAFVGITLPSMYFWFMNKDDKEINDLRKTQSGQKYWFVRSPVDAPKLALRKGDIVKIPKPIVDGQIFGSSMEAYLDKAYGNDPATVGTAANAVAKDIGFNVLPTAGVLYYGLQTNQNLGTGGNLVPGADENLALEHQGEDKASWLARSVSAKAAPLIGPNAPAILQHSVTPAGLDYIMGTVGGMLGQDGLIAITQAVEAETKGYVPAKEELPVVQRVFAGYPSSNVAPIQRFYDRAAQVQTVGATITHLVKEDPTKLLPYMGSNQADYILLGVYTKARQDIANYRRAFQDIKDAPAGTMSSDDRRTYQKQFQTLMIETARMVNNFTIEVDKSTAKK